MAEEQQRPGDGTVRGPEALDSTELSMTSPRQSTDRTCSDCCCTATLCTWDRHADGCTGREIVLPSHERSGNLGRLWLVRQENHSGRNQAETTEEAPNEHLRHELSGPRPHGPLS